MNGYTTDGWSIWSTYHCLTEEGNVSLDRDHPSSDARFQSDTG